MGGAFCFPENLRGKSTWGTFSKLGRLRGGGIFARDACAVGGDMLARAFCESGQGARFHRRLFDKDELLYPKP